MRCLVFVRAVFEEACIWVSTFEVCFFLVCLSLCVFFFSSAPVSERLTLRATSISMIFVSFLFTCFVSFPFFCFFASPQRFLGAVLCHDGLIIYYCMVTC